MDLKVEAQAVVVYGYQSYGFNVPGDFIRGKECFSWVTKFGSFCKGMGFYLRYLNKGSNLKRNFIFQNQ